MSIGIRSLILLLFAGAGASPLMSAVGLELHPVDPQSHEQLAIGVSGESSCSTLDPPTVDPGTGIVRAVLYLECPILPPSPSPFLLWETVGPLSPGVWEIRIEDPGGDVLASQELRVRRTGFDLEVVPESPTVLDEVTLRLRGVGSCVWHDPPTVDGGTLAVTVFEQGLCDPPPPVGPYELDLVVGALELGSWEILYSYAGIHGPQLVATKHLEVRPAGSCTSEPSTLCLQGGRFRVEAGWRTPDGASGRAQALPVTTDSGLFWFFREDNLELLVKVLDGCGLFGHYWVYASGVSDLEVELTVTDTLTGADWSYRNEPETPFGPVFDPRAFATCSP